MFRDMLPASSHDAKTSLIIDPGSDAGLLRADCKGILTSGPYFDIHDHMMPKRFDLG